MRLLRTRTLDLEAFYDPGTRPRYAVLSHTWEPGRHLTYSDLAADPEHALSGTGSELVRRACDVAQKLGHEYLWVECICVDGSSTAEVSEAVNSSFRWYQEASACLVYLADLPSEYPDDETSWRECRWWTRAWTLPELLAPPTVRFYDEDWNFRGTKTSPPILDIISHITHISEHVLRDGSLIRRTSVAKRMSWAATRKARRVEDMAYSLLGIFGVHMQTVYGEGTESFKRLQDEILKDTRDMSLLAWEAQPDDKRLFRGLFASSPKEFVRFISCPPEWTTPLSFAGEIQSTSKGLSITAPFISYPCHSQRILLLDLGTHVQQRKTALVLFRYNDYYVRPATNATISTEPGGSTTTSISAMRDLDVPTSCVVSNALAAPTFANGELTLPPAEKTPRQPTLAASLPLRGPTHPVALARRRGNRSITESSDTYVISCASTSLASMSPMLNASQKRSLPPNALVDRADKRARTRPVAFPSQPGSDITAIQDARSDTSSGSTSSQEDLSVSDSTAPGPPPVLEEGHPFLAVTDELTKAARAEFTSWQKTASSSGTLYFACPFLARDPDRHSTCLKRAVLRQPRDVKLHLWRKHRLPHHCPVCYDQFETASETNAHIVQRSCELRQRSSLEGVSEDQKIKLMRKDKIPGSREDKWRAIWDILFPGEPPPSPYPEGEDALICLVREFWEEKGQVVVSGFLEERGMLGWEVKDEERGLAALYALVLERMVDDIYEEEKWEVVQLGTIPPRLPQERSSLLNGLLSSASVSMLGAGFPFQGTDPYPGAPPLPRRGARSPGARRAVGSPSGRRDSTRSIRFIRSCEPSENDAPFAGMPSVP